MTACFIFVNHTRNAFFSSIGTVAGLPNFWGDLKMSDQNNWGDLSKKLNLGEGAMNPNDALVVMLKDILLCLLGFRFIYIVDIS